MVMRRRLLAAKVPFDLEAAACDKPARPDIRVYPGLGFDDVILVGFEPSEPWPDGIQGLDGVDQWSAGRLREDGTFEVMTDAYRSRTAPELPNILQVPMGMKGLAVLIVDVMGNRYCFRVNRDDPKG